MPTTVLLKPAKVLRKRELGKNHHQLAAWDGCYNANLAVTQSIGIPLKSIKI